MENNNITTTNNGAHVSGAPLTTALTAEASPGLLRNAIDERIVRVRPTATPVDQISRCIGARSCDAMTIEYLTSDVKPFRSVTTKQIATSFMLADDTGNYVIEIDVADGCIFSPTDTVIFPSVYASLDKKEALTAYVLSVDDKTLELVILNGFKGADTMQLPKIDKGSEIVRMGRAASELDVQTAQYQAMPRRLSNNCQIFKMQVEQSTLNKIAAKEADWNLSDQEEAAVVDMRLGMEKNFLFGSKQRITAPNGREHIYLTGGIWNQAARKFELSVDALTEQDLLDLCAEVFTGNNGSKKRILMAGTGLVLALNKMQYSRAIVADQSLTRWGIRFRELVSNFGTLYVVHSEVFDLCGHRNDGFILDPDYITKYTHIPFTKERIDLRRAGDRNTDAVVLTEASCVVLRYPDVHARIIGVTAPPRQVETGGGSASSSGSEQAGSGNS